MWLMLDVTLCEFWDRTVFVFNKTVEGLLLVPNY